MAFATKAFANAPRPWGGHPTPDPVCPTSPSIPTHSKYGRASLISASDNPIRPSIQVSSRIGWHSNVAENVYVAYGSWQGVDGISRKPIVPEMAALFYPYSGKNPVRIYSFATTSDVTHPSLK